MATYTALVDVKVNTRKVNEAFKNIEGSLGSINKRSAQTNQRLQRMEATFNRVNKQLSSLNKTQVNSIRAFTKMSSGASASADTIEKLQKQVKELKKQIDGSKKSILSFGNIFKSLNKVYKENAYLIQSITAGLFGFIQYELIGGLRRMTDQFILMSSRLKVVNSSTKVFNQNLQAAFEIAQDTRQPLFQVANTMARIGRNSKTLQKDLAGLHRITATIGKSFQVAGATIEEANNAMIQLSQAFASGRLQGDELRSVLELAPRLAQGIAKQIGISVGSLRAFAKEGKLTTEVLRKAIRGASAEVDRDFKKIQKTIGQSLTLINNSIMNLVGNTDRAVGANRAFADAFTRLSKAIDRLQGNKVILGIADSIKYFADNLETFLKVATTLVASGVLTAIIFSFKTLVGVLLGPAGLIFGTIATGVYLMLDAMTEVPAGVDKAAKSFTSIDDAIEESTMKITRMKQELENLTSDGLIKTGFQKIGKYFDEYVVPVFEYMTRFQPFPYIERLIKDGKKIAEMATSGAKKLIGGEKITGGPSADPKAYAKFLKKNADIEREQTIKSELERFQLKERLNKEQAKKDAEEAAARAAFLKTYEVELNAAKALNKERLKGVREELKFRGQQQNLFDTFGAAKYAGEVGAARSARERFTKILGSFNESPGQFGQVVQGGRVSEDSLMQALKTPALEQRFKDEPALLDALALEARKIADNLNTDLIEAEERRLVEQKILYFRYLDDISQQAKSVADQIALAQIGDPSSLSGGALAQYNKLSDQQAGDAAVGAARRGGITDDGQLEAIREQTILLNKQQRALQHINQLNQIRSSTEQMIYAAGKKALDRTYERNILTGELTKKAKIQKLHNDEILGVAEKLNISADKLSVTKDGQVDLDLKGLKLSKEEKELGKELILQAQKRINIEKAAMASGKIDDPASQQAVQDNVTGGVLKAGGESAQRAVSAAKAYQAAGGGLMGLINMIADLILSNKKVMEAIGKIFDAIMEPIDAIIDPLGELITAIMLLLKPFQQINKMIGKALGSIVKMLTSIIHPFSQLLELLQPFLLILTAALQMLVQFINTLLGGIIDAIITPIIEGIMDVFGMGTEEGYKPETLLQAEADILDDIESSLEGAASALEKINDVVFEITNSALNLLAPSIKLEDAKAKYNELKQLATTIGSDEYIDEFTSYAQTYLQQSQDVLKSSSAYQAIYDQVIGDLEDLQKLEFQGMSKNLTDEIRTAAFNLDLVGSDLGESIREMIQKFKDGSVDFVDILTYVAYKQGQIASDLALYEMADFGGVDLAEEKERIKKARGTADSSSSLEKDLETLGIIGGSTASGSTASSTINAQNVVVNSQGRGTGRSVSSYSYLNENRQETFGDVGESQSYSTIDAGPLGNLFSGSFDLGELFANIGQMIIDGLIAALKSLGAAAADILAAVFGFIEDAFKGITNVAEQILGAVLGPILQGLGEVGNVAGQFLTALFSVFEGIAVNAGQFLTGIFMPILRIGAIAIDQFLSAVLYPITKAIEGAAGAVGGVFLDMIVNPILNALGLDSIDTEAFTGIFDNVIESYKSVFSNLDFGAYFDGLSGAVSNMFDGITKIFQLDFDGAGESFTAAFESMWDGITGLFGIDMSFEEGMANAKELLSGVWDTVTGLFDLGDMNFGDFDISKIFTDVWDNITGVFDFGTAFDLGDFNIGDFDFGGTVSGLFTNISDAIKLPTDFSFPDVGKTLQGMASDILPSIQLPTDFEFPDIGKSIQSALSGAFSFGDSLSIDLDIGSSIQSFIDSAFSFTKGEPQDVKLLPNPLHQFDIGPDYFIKFKFGEGGEIPKFANGGMVRGPSHEQGGVLAELEGGEMVLSKNRVKQIEEARQKFGKYTSSNIDRAKARNKDGDCLGCMNFKVGGITPVKLDSSSIIFDKKTSDHINNPNPTYGPYTRPPGFDFGASSPGSPAGREIKDDYDVRSKALGKNMMKPKSATTGSSSFDDENVWSELFWSMLSLMAGFDTKTLGNSVQQIIASPNLSTAASVAIGTPLSLLMGSLFFNARSGFESAVDAVQGTNSGYTNMTKGGAGEKYGKATSKVNNPKGVPSYNDVEKYKSYATGGMTEKDEQKYSSFPHGTSDSPKNWDIGTRFRGGFRTGNSILGDMALGVDADITDPLNWKAFAEWDCPNIEYDDRCKFMVDYGIFGGKKKVTTGWEELDNGLGNILAISSFGRCDDNLINLVKRNVPWLAWLPLSVETESTATMDFCDGLGKMGGAIVDGAKGLTEFADGLPTFASGGALGRMGGMAKGPSHKNGGIKGMVGGKQPIEFEGGEYIIKKDTAQRLGTPFLDQLNEGAMFAEGGSFDPLASSGGTSSTGGVVNREISLFNPITFDTLSSLNPDSTIYEAFEDLEFYEVGFQEVGNELIDELQLLRQALAEGNLILETAVQEMSDRLKIAIDKMSADIQGVIVFMEGELLKALKDIETAIKDIGPSLGDKFNELVEYFTTVITETTIENSLGDAFLKYFGVGTFKDDFIDALKEVFTFKDDALKIAIAGVDTGAQGGSYLKVRVEEMGDPYKSEHFNNLNRTEWHENLADEIIEAAVIAFAQIQIGAYLGSLLAGWAGATGILAALIEGFVTYALPFVINYLQDNVNLENLEKNIGALFSSQFYVDIISKIGEGLFLGLEALVYGDIGRVFESIGKGFIEYAGIFLEVVKRFLGAPGKFFESFGQAFGEFLKQSGIEDAILFAGKIVKAIYEFLLTIPKFLNEFGSALGDLIKMPWEDVRRAIENILLVVTGIGLFGYVMKQAFGIETPEELAAALGKVLQEVFNGIKAVVEVITSVDVGAFLQDVADFIGGIKIDVDLPTLEEVGKFFSDIADFIGDNIPDIDLSQLPTLDDVIGFFQDVADFLGNIKLPELPDIDIDIDIQELISPITENLSKFFLFLGRNVFGGEGVDVDSFFKMESLEQFAENFDALFENVELPDIGGAIGDLFSGIEIDPGKFIEEIMSPVTELVLDAGTFLFGNSPTGLLAPVQELAGKLDPSEYIRGMIDGFGEMNLNVGSLFEFLITKFFEGYGAAQDLWGQLLNIAFGGLESAGIPIAEVLGYIMKPFSELTFEVNDVLLPILEPISKLQMTVLDFISEIFAPIYNVALEADQWLAEIMKPIQNLVVDVATFLFGNSPTGLLAPIEALVGLIDPSVFLNTILEAIMGVEGAAKGAAGAVDGIVETITGFILGFFEQFAAVLHSFIPTQVAEVFGNVSEEIMNTFLMIGNAFVGLLGDIIGFLGEALDPSDFAKAFDMTVAFNILGATGRAGSASAPNAVEFNFLPDLLKGNIFGSVSKTGIGVRAFGTSVGMTTDYEAGGLLKGPSHANGGIPGMVGSKFLPASELKRLGIDNRTPVEMEGGEYIIKKSTVEALGIPFFDFLNAQDKTTVSGSPTNKSVKNYFKGGLMDPLRDATKTIYDWSVSTGGDIARILGDHGIDSFLKFKTGIPAAALRVYERGGPVEGALSASSNLMGQMKQALVDISGSNFLGSAGFEAGLEGGKSLMVNPYTDTYLRINRPDKWKFFEQGGYVNSDPEVANLLAELIQAVKDKEMGVNIYNETGQNMRVSDGEGAGFNESSYRESSSLA